MQYAAELTLATYHVLVFGVNRTILPYPVTIAACHIHVTWGHVLTGYLTDVKAHKG